MKCWLTKLTVFYVCVKYRIVNFLMLDFNEILYFIVTFYDYWIVHFDYWIVRFEYWIVQFEYIFTIGYFCFIFTLLFRFASIANYSLIIKWNSLYFSDEYKFYFQLKTIIKTFDLIINVFLCLVHFSKSVIF
jgi:hypothetical protein